MIKAKTNGNRLVQQKLINWSKRILGNDALTQPPAFFLNLKMLTYPPGTSQQQISSLVT